jgi:AAA domain-containing protein/primase-like protein
MTAHDHCKISQNEVAGYVIAILTGKLAPRQYKKSGRWGLDLAPVAIESAELPNYDTEQLVRLVVETLEPFVVDDEFEEEPNNADPPEQTHEILAKPDSKVPRAFPEPDRDQLEIFVQALFRHCDPNGVVSVRSFHQEDSSKSFGITPIPLKDGLKPLIEAAVKEARRAANAPAPIAFTPPVATFKASAGWQAREEDLLEGPVLSLELDENPRAALATLERLLGPATLVVRSGGKWTKPTTGEEEDKLHAYWRLKEPARGEDLKKLKELRRRATTLVGGDRSNIPINHPIRWPGSWHRKGEPRLCEIVSTDQLDNEIDLDIALAILEDVSDLPLQPLDSERGPAPPPETLEFAPGFADIPYEDLWGNPYPKTADPERIAAALAVIPNTQRLYTLRGNKINGSEDDPLDWHGWISIGLAIWSGTGGTKEGEAVFLTWSRKWPKYIAGTEAEKARFDRTTAERWAAFSKCPPDKIGAGTIFFLADKASPGWREEYDAERAQSEQNEARETSGFGEIPNSQGATSSAQGTQQQASGLGEWNAAEDVDPPPPRGWLLANTFARTFLSSIIGAGGTGKTALRYAQALSLATGRELTGEHVFQRCRVLIVSLEDDANELRRRIRAVRLHYDIPLSELDGWLFLAAPGAKAGKLMVTDQRGRAVHGSLGANLEAVVIARKTDLVMLDPFIKTHSVEENANSAIDDVAQQLTDLANKHNIAVDAPHHVRKGQMTPGDADAGRGASAYIDACRLVSTCSPMSEEDAKTFSITDRWEFIRVDSGKPNIARRNRNPKWFRLVGVKLDNATELYPSGDEVQTVVPWEPPNAWTGPPR